MERAGPPFCPTSRSPQSPCERLSWRARTFQGSYGVSLQIWVLLVGVEWDFTVVWIWIFLMTSDVWHFQDLGHFNIFFVKWFKILPMFIVLFFTFWCWVVGLWIWVFRYMHNEYFLLVCSLPFYFFFFFFRPHPQHAEISLARDGTCTTAAIRATAVTTLHP